MVRASWWLPRPRPGTSLSGSAGFTLVELLVAMVLFGLTATMGAWGLRAYQNAQDQRGSADAVASALRNAAERAQSEGRTYCVSFDTDRSWSVWRYSCDPTWTSGTASALRVSQDQRVHGGQVVLGGFTFAAGVGVGSCPAGAGRCAYFYPRGTANGGSLTVGRAGAGTVDTVTLEGLTSRVDVG